MSATSQIPDDPADGVINLQTVKRRISMSISDPVIRLDGKPIGTWRKQQRFDMVMGITIDKSLWIATLTDVEGHRASAEERSFAQLASRVPVLVTGILRRHFPDADHGPLIVESAPEEINRFRDGRQNTLYVPYAKQWARKVALDRKIVIHCGKGLGKLRLEGVVIDVQKMAPGDVWKKSPGHRWRYPNCSNFAAVRVQLGESDQPETTATTTDSERTAR